MSIALKFKQTVATISAGAIFASLFVFSAGTASAQTFSDVDPTHWGYDVLEGAVDLGIVDPGAMFRLNDPVNRAEFFKMLAIATDAEAGCVQPATDTFKDAAKGMWFTPRIECLAQLGIVTGDTLNGVPTGFVRPAALLNRAEATAAVVRGFDLVEDLMPEAPFPDMVKGSWYEKVATTAYNWSVINGDQGMFAPARNITRIEAVAIIMRSMNPVNRGGEDPVNPDEDGICPEDEPTDPDCDPKPDPTNFLGDLEVSLNDTVKGGTLPLNATNVVLAKFDFTAKSGDVNVDTLTVDRSGVGLAGDFSNVYIFQDDVRKSSGKTFKDNSNDVTFTNLQDLIIKSGETSEVTIVAEVAGPGVAESGGEHVISLEVADSVVLNGAGDVTGDFAMSGPEFTIGSQGTLVNSVTVTKGSSLANIPLGSVQSEMATIKLEAGNDHNLELSQITLTQGGTVDSSDIVNLTLELSGDNEPLATAATIENDRVTFILDEPLLIEEGKTKNVSVYGDVVGGKTTDNIRWYLDENTDVEATDLQFNYGAQVINDFTLALSNLVKLEGGDITVTKTGPISTQIASDSDDNVFTNYRITNVLEGVEVRDTQIGVTIKDSNGNIPNFSNDTGLFDVVPLAPGICAPGQFELNFFANSPGFTAGDMVKAGSFYGRVVSTDLTPINGGLCVYSSDDWTTLAANATIAEVNAYAFLSEITVVDVTDGVNDEEVVASSSKLVSEGTLCTADNVPANLPVCNAANTYATNFTDDYDLRTGINDYSIRMDVGQEMVAGYQVAAAVQFPDNTMKFTDSNEFVLATEIVGAGSVALVGNFMSIVEDDLLVSKSALPTSQTFVKGSLNVPVLGVTFQSGDAGEITLNDMKVRFYADDSANPWAAPGTGDIAANTLIATASLYDGNTLVAGPESLDLVDTGAAGFTANADYFVADFNDIDTLIKSGVSKTLTVKVDLLGNDVTGFFAADVVPASDIDAEDKDGDTVTPGGAALNGTTTKSPLITISNAGTLTFTSQGNPNPGIIVAGTDDEFVAQYDVKAINDDFNITRLSVGNDVAGDIGDGEQFTDAVEQVVLKYTPGNNAPVIEATAPFNENGVAIFNNLNFPVTKNVSGTLKVYVDVATKGQGPGEALSGRVVRAGMLNIGNVDATFRAVGLGSQTVVNTPTVVNNTNVPIQVVRLSMPTMTKVAANPDMDPNETTLFSFKVAADAAGPVSFGRFVFDIDQTGVVNAEDFRFFRGAQVLNNVKIFKAGGTDISPTGAPFGAGLDGQVIVSFTAEETVTAGSNITYSLKAVPTAAAVDNTISTKFAIGDENVTVAGISAGSTCTTTDNALCSTGNANTGRIYDTEANEGLFDNGDDDFSFVDSLGTARNFLWSDNSADAHSYPTFCTGAAAPDAACAGVDSIVRGSGSFDWTNGFLLRLTDISSQVVEKQ